MTTATRRRTSSRRSVAQSAGNSERADAYQLITDQIIELLDAGTAPWHKPWRNSDGYSGLPLSLSTGKAYRGINPFLLQVATIANGYDSPWWATYDKITERGGQVRRGEKHTKIVFWSQYVRKAKSPDDEDTTGFVLRVYRVFNTDQADGLTMPPVATNRGPDFDPIAECENAVAAYYANGGPQLVYAGNRACYNPGSDTVRMPQREQFDSPARFYGTWFHETTHSTGHKERLARPDLLEMHAFGDASYSREELVAEMGAALLAGITGIEATTLPNSASYLRSWLDVLRGDKKLVIIAAAQAQKAADLILGVTHDDS